MIKFTKDDIFCLKFIQFVKNDTICLKNEKMYSKWDNLFREWLNNDTTCLIITII